MIAKRVFIRVLCTLQSPLAIGGGDTGGVGGVETDIQVIRDAGGSPFVPGSSFAGILRHGMAEADARRLMGFIRERGDPLGEGVASRLDIGDGIFNGKPGVSTRDGVALHRDRTPKDGAKYDYEIVEAGETFEVHLEYTLYDGEPDFIQAPLRAVLRRVHRGELTLGRRGTRGFGRLSLACARKDYAREDLLASLSHDWAAMQDPWDLDAETVETEEAETAVRIHVALTLNSALSIRAYTSINPDGSSGDADYQQLLSGGVPVVPGTTWAGALRSRARQLLIALGLSADRAQARCRMLFGHVPQERGARATMSRVRIGETRLTGGALQTIDRTAIDRFTGGAANGALFTERVLAPEPDCSGDLVLLLPKDGPNGVPQWGVGLLLLALEDLRQGMLPVGGCVSVGRGIFRVNTITVDGMDPDDASRALAEMLRKEEAV